MARLLHTLKLLAVIGVITAFAGCASGQKRETAGQYVDDSVVTAKVKAAIIEEPSLKASQVNVETYKGVVQLSGFVDSPQQIQKATEVAGKVEGVKEVRNDLMVKR